MAFAPDPARILALASAVGLLLLAGALVALPRRDGRARVFAAFAALWALQVTAANLAASETEPARATPLFAASVAFNIPLYLLLAYFVSAYPLRDGILVRSKLAFALAALPGLAAAGVMAIRPELLVGGVATPGSVVGWRSGPLFPWLVILPFRAALGYAVWRFGREARAAGTPLLATRSALIATAFGAFLAYDAPGYLLYYTGTFDTARLWDSFGYVLGFAIGTFAYVRLLDDLRRCAWAGRRKALVFLLAGAATGVAEILVLLNDVRIGGVALSRYDTVGFWRITMVGLVLLALARHQLFDLDARLAFVARPSFLAGLGLVGFVTAAGLAREPLGASFAPVVGLGGALLMLAIARPLARSLGAASRPRETEYVLERKLQVYRASVEEALAKPTDTEEDRLWLATLRENLGISDSTHGAIERSVRAQLGADGRLARGPATLYRGRFRIERVLGGGGGGQVLLAEDVRLGRRVVLKELGAARRADPAAVAALLREARLLAGMTHPNVLTIHEVVDGGEDPVLVMEYCEDGSVQDYILQRGGRVAPAEALRIAKDALRGLAAIHQQGLVHRDVKPANLLIARTGTKVADFGLALRGSSMTAMSLHAARQPGTLPYMSPEQVRGERLDARTDLYSLAAAFYHMLTGDMYYGDAQDDVQIRAAILERSPRLERAPEWARPFLVKGLAKDRDARFQSADEMLQALPAPTGITQLL